MLHMASHVWNILYPSTLSSIRCWNCGLVCYRRYPISIGSQFTYCHLHWVFIVLCRLHLTSLNLANNSINSLPPQLGSMSSLRSMPVIGNPIRNLKPSLLTGPVSHLLQALRLRIPDEVTFQIINSLVFQICRREESAHLSRLDWMTRYKSYMPILQGAVQDVM